MNKMRAIIDYTCMEDDCDQVIQFNLMQLKENKGILKCPCCHRQYEFADDLFLSKLEKLRKLLLAVQDAEEILGDCNVGVTTLNGEVKIPYRLLLTRLNTMITLDVGGVKVDFHFRVEPLDNASFR
ncbi:MAG: hypothetical protein NE334_03790 [Lentisphaeraceae bacterium]|nr:hypothetical protein [Lentisphaeraceae bacterium]